MTIHHQPQPQAASREFDRLSFTGNAGEYFGIWIVNVLLTILTLGIYSAWAKVRRNRYFYGNTVLLGRGFEYHATAKQILIGRLIVFAFLVFYQLMLNFVPIVGLILTVPLIIALPWLIARGLRFNARMTSYRNVRFDFVGKPGGAFVTVFLGAIVATLSLGILAPLASRWLYRYLLNNLRYGDRAFTTDPKIGKLYNAWIGSLMMVLQGVIILAILMFVLVIFMGSDIREPFGREIFGLLLGFVVVITYARTFLFYQAGVRNVALSATLFAGAHELRSDLSRGRYTWIAISNVIVTILTLGLMRPWAAVRMARYVNQCTAVRFNGSIDDIVSTVGSRGSVVGSEYMDMEGVDFGF